MPDNACIPFLGGLPVPQLEACLDALDAEQGDVAIPRSEEELTSPAACIRFRHPPLELDIRNPAGGIRRVTALPRMLCTGGLAILHSGFVFPQSPVNLALPTLNGEPLHIKASVDACRHVIAIVHETRLTFVPDVDLRRHIRIAAPAPTAA